jgi:uncharacterized protein
MAIECVVTVAYAAPDVEALVVVRVPPGTSVGDTVAQSGIVARLGLDASRLDFAIFGRRVRADTPVADGDRVELTRPLEADPKRIRRSRAASRNPP